MQLGVDGVFVGSGIFKSHNPEKRAKAMVQAVTHYKDPKILAEVSEDLGEAMVSRYQLWDCSKANLLCPHTHTHTQVGLNCDNLSEKWAYRESTHN